MGSFSAKIRIIAFVMSINFTITTIVFAQFTSAPHLNSTIHDVSLFIASDEFADLKRNLTSPEIIDSLYTYALDLCNYNISETLLTLMFATLPYHTIPVRIPLLESKITVPLPSTSIDIFKRKVVNLPANIFFCSINKNSDKDKLAHFYGNAYLSYNLSFFNISKFMSIFVELFEYSFKVEGAIDFRDLQTDMLGENFGIALSKNRNLTPSRIMFTYFMFYTIYVI